VIVVAGSELLVESAVGLATALGVPSIVVGLTVVAMGTSLPELVTAITSAHKNVSDLAIGNVLGANIANLTFIVGTASSIHDVTMSRLTQIYNFPAMLALMLLSSWLILSGRKITRREGGILLAFYAVYIVVLVALTLANKGG
jgi:cation:H+ antiporter